jgi:Rrf2 family transcriptional regulator, iron-sulfur cluster assembly transcription factor
MVRINRQTDYAVRVVLALAKQDAGTRLSTPAIQREMQIPQAMMPRIIAELARAGLIHTFPGRDGGMTLAHPAAQISLRDVVEAFEGPILLSQCLQVRGESDCPFQMSCPVRSKWGRVQAAMLLEMADISFENLAREAQGVPMLVHSAVL